MKLTIEHNHKPIKVTHYPNLKRLYSDVHSELEQYLFTNTYKCMEIESLEVYNDYAQLEKKIKIFGLVHMATIKTLNNKYDYFITKN